MYSQKRNCAASVPISMCLWVIYIFPQSVCIFCGRKICGPTVGIYMNRSKTHDCGNWDWGRIIPFLGIFVSNFRYCALQRQNAENLKQIFPEKKYLGVSSNFHIHVSVSELYIPTMGLPFLLEEICGPNLGIYRRFGPLRGGQRGRWGRVDGTWTARVEQKQSDIAIELEFKKNLSSEQKQCPKEIIFEKVKKNRLM
jgi:hypothetical protein